MNNVKKSIGWCDWTINPVKGLCPRNNICLDNQGKPYCYARRAYNRNCNSTFKDKSIRYDDTVFYDLSKAKSGDKIFIGSTIDLFHPLASRWTPNIIKTVEQFHRLTFIFLTKCPENLPKEWPDNCWVGVSITKALDAIIRIPKLDDMKAPVKFVSFEPLLGAISSSLQIQLLLQRSGIKWLIIGAQTPYSKKTAPQIEWVKEIVEAADKAKIPVFLKSNLRNLLIEEAYQDKLFFQSAEDWGEGCTLRQDFPSNEK